MGRCSSVLIKHSYYINRFGSESVTCFWAILDEFCRNRKSRFSLIALEKRLSLIWSLSKEAVFVAHISSVGVSVGL